MDFWTCFCIFLINIFVTFGVESTEWNTHDFMKREHSLVKPYQGMGMTIPYWDFLGSTMVTKNYIRLTPDLQSRDLFGDGFAIWYAKDRMASGPVFGNKDFFHGLAVILDTYSNHNGPHNHQHPYISAMINNGSLHYDHDRDGTHTQLAGCEAKFLSTDISNKAAWQECFKVNGIKLPTGYYFGISATTGDLSDHHDILSVKLYELDLPDSLKDTEDRSNIIPSATFFESPRGKSCGRSKAFFSFRYQDLPADVGSCSSNYCLRSYWNNVLSKAPRKQSQKILLIN
ncbi:hypothetical protein G9C98_000753 [Cotesia typhae]|uniref:L-type lectin-like domain-containing protein n=1 Tax=Cotesia typhae TaxID=2053667 RepID=A0A8J5QSW7_9HYME|nr:hypothetical protein G9C98_000753 [Cotesia typhae]